MNREGENSIFFHSSHLRDILIELVKKGDKNATKNFLTSSLGDMFYYDNENCEIAAALGLELLARVSRVYIEAGTDSKKIFDITAFYVSEISKVDSFAQLEHLLEDVFDRFILAVFPSEPKENTLAVKKAMDYIGKNFSGKITLSAVADEVYLSHAYFSRLFKSEVGMTFSEYLNFVRVEESKKYLEKLEYSISEAASAVGFTDQSYYTKVFKKREGISPGQYRKSR